MKLHKSNVDQDFIDNLAQSFADNDRGPGSDSQEADGNQRKCLT